VTALAELLALKAEPYKRKATIFEWSTGRRWTMPANEWLFDECYEFTMHGKLDAWLAYYRNFEGLK
jgi:hypothetical protein